ncbi:heterokaryon incompatibility protein-domain-containing protein [Jackrogersella minutella]|nr:heterokaryon incompatibility protein-domain-containing protein [Jackrogersella minutella]
MRLLNTSSITLEEFQGSAPDYAILSHTWLTGEVTLQDLSEDKGRTKAGWHKILNCCLLCLREGWKYVWIDTCCIDKTSSAELSEAINSMFAWYQRAGICYAYLSDVDMASRENPDLFTNSRWFTRGWTLQELIAPQYLMFLNTNWSEIGSRSYFSSAIEKTTGISDYYMDNFQSCSIAVKMSWAAKRRTTRIEDQAYCLLGLFGINMPLLYGEERKAFIRLQQEILKVSDDESIFAWHAPTSVIQNSQDILCGMLAPSADYFTKSNYYHPSVIDEQRAEYAMTNKGLGMSIDIWRYIGPEHGEGARPRRYLAPLNCKSDHPVAVILLHDGGESYVRTDPDTLVSWQDETANSNLWELIPRKRLYVRQVQEYSSNLNLSRRTFYHFSFKTYSSVRLRKAYNFPSGSYNVQERARLDGLWLGTDHSLNFINPSSQTLLYMDLAGVELVLCISPVDDFFALSIFFKRQFEEQLDILERAGMDAAMKRATESASLEIPEQNLTVEARLRPRPTQQPVEWHIAKFVQVSIGCRFTMPWIVNLPGILRFTGVGNSGTTNDPEGDNQVS